MIFFAINCKIFEQISMGQFLIRSIMDYVGYYGPDYNTILSYKSFQPKTNFQFTFNLYIIYYTFQFMFLYGHKHIVIL